MEAINNLVAFKAISNFIRDLSQVFADKNRSLALYNRLIEKTSITNEKPIAKHIECFTAFCTANRDAILAKDRSKITNNTITYSEKVFLNIDEILDESDEETREAVWNHLLAISAVVDPASNAKKILRESMERRIAVAGDGQGKEAEFINNIVEKIESNITPEAMQNPMAAIGTMLSSGVLTDMVGNLQKGLSDGSIDIGRLLGTFQGMAGGLGGGEGGSGPMNLPFDMTTIMGMMSGMMNQPKN